MKKLYFRKNAEKYFSEVGQYCGVTQLEQTVA